MRHKNLIKLFESKENSIELDVARGQWIEEVCKLMGKVLLVYILFWGLNWVGAYLVTHKELLYGEFDSSFLFSIFVLPLLYSLKDVKDCCVSLSVEVWQDNTSITVKRGWLWRKYDKLYFNDLNNIELYQSLGGRIGQYCSLDLYAVGGVVSLPYLKDTDKNRKAVSSLMKIARENGEKEFSCPHHRG